MYIDEADIDHIAATDGDPGLPYPFEIDVPVDQNVKVGVPVPLEFEDSDVLRSDSVLALQVDPQFGEHGIQITNRIAFNL